MCINDEVDALFMEILMPRYDDYLDVSFSFFDYLYGLMHCVKNVKHKWGRCTYKRDNFLVYYFVIFICI